MSPRSSHESGVLKGRRPWKREASRDDQRVADRLDHMLHDDITETQADMVEDRALTARGPSLDRQSDNDIKNSLYHYGDSS